MFLDDAFAFGLPAIVGLKLRVGQTLSDAEIEKLKGEATIEAAKQSAFNFLSYRPRSRSEMQRNLRKKEYEDSVILQTIETLERLEMVDDRAFARYWVEQRETFKPRSQMALRQELAQKGIDRDIIAEVLDTVDEVASARKAAEGRASRWLHLPEDEFRVKLGRYLQNRGFYYGIIRQVTDEIWEAHTEMMDDDE